MNPTDGTDAGSQLWQGLSSMFDVLLMFVGDFFRQILAAFLF